MIRWDTLAARSADAGSGRQARLEQARLVPPPIGIKPVVLRGEIGRDREARLTLDDFGCMRVGATALPICAKLAARNA